MDPYPFRDWQKLSPAERLILLTMAWLRIQSGDPNRYEQKTGEIFSATGLSQTQFSREVLKLGRKKLLRFSEHDDGKPETISLRGRARTLELLIVSRTTTEVRSRVMPDE